MGGRAAEAAFYSIQLITEILKGIKDTADAEQDLLDAKRTTSEALMAAVIAHPPGTDASQPPPATSSKRTTKFRYADGTSVNIDLSGHFRDAYRDEYTNEPLSATHIADAIYDELDYFNDNVWVGVSLDEAMADKEGKIIGTRLVNSNKNDILNPDVRARLVAQDVSQYVDESFYAATPPLEA